MIKILILFLVFIFLVFLLNTKNENFSNVNLKCGTLLRNLNASNLVNNLGGSAASGIAASGIAASGNAASGSAASGSAAIGSAASGSNSDGSNVSTHVNTQVHLETVDPLLPECVGICINQHTYTTDNTRNIFIPNPEFITQRKSNQSDDTVMRTKCGECINNFYQGLILMKEQSSECNL